MLTILSDISKIFDPLGWISSSTILAKLNARTVVETSTLEYTINTRNKREMVIYLSKAANTQILIAKTGVAPLK